jgi:hypothetical protein
VTGGLLTSDRWCDSNGVCCTYYIYITGGVTVVGHGDLTSDRWGDISGPPLVTTVTPPATSKYTTDHYSHTTGHY